MHLSPFAKQMLVATTSHFAAVSMGGSLGYPCVLLQQFQSNETSIHTDLDTLTWIAAMHGVAGIGATLMPTIMQYKGRKSSFIGSCLILLIGWILAFAAKDVLTVLLSAIFHGLASNCITIVNLVVIGEMLAPKYRGANMIMLNIDQTLGQVLVTTLGTVLNWRTVALIMCAPMIVSLLLVGIWPETPMWLAYKRKFEASEKAYIWLRGTDNEAMTEFKAMIAAQKETRQNISKKTKLQEVCKKMKQRDFYLPSLFMFLIFLNFYSCGGLSLYIYCKDILEFALEDSKIATIGFVATVCTLFFGALLALIFIRFFKTKTVLSSGVGCILALLCCSLVHYLRKIGIIPKDSLLFLYFYLSYMIFSNSGFNPVTYALAIDLVPVKHRGFGGALFNILTCLMYVVTVKSLPYIMFSIDITGLFIIYASCSTICMILIWIYVPETKNRTLQEIEDYYNFGSFEKYKNLDDVEVKPIFKDGMKD